MRKFQIGDKIRGTSADIDGCEGEIHAVNNCGEYKIKLTKLGKETFHGSDRWILGDYIKNRDGSIRWSQWSSSNCLELILCLAFHS